VVRNKLVSVVGANPPSDIASGRITEVRSGSMSCNCMTRTSQQKCRSILERLAQIMLEKTDDEHYITMPEIMKALATYEVTADRKSIYNDLRDLEKLGIEVEGEPVGK